MKDIISATDAGREGELVARFILDKAGNKKPIRRWIAQLLKKLFNKVFKNLKEVVNITICIMQR